MFIKAISIILAEQAIGAGPIPQAYLCCAMQHNQVQFFACTYLLTMQEPWMLKPPLGMVTAMHS
jgi:hypothetical protein